MRAKSPADEAGSRASVDEVAIVEGIAAGPLLHVGDDEGEVGDVAGYAGVGVQAHHRAHGRGGLGVGVERGGDLFADGGGVVVKQRHGDERTEQVGEVVVEGRALGEAAIEGFKGGGDGAAEVESADVGLGVELERDHGERAAHGSASDVGFCWVAVSVVEVVAQGLGFRVGLRERPAGLRVGALDDGVVAFEEGELLRAELFRGVEGDTVLGVAVVEDHQRVVPGVRHIDAVLRAFQHANFGGAEGRGEDVGRDLGLFFLCEGRDGAQKYAERHSRKAA